MDKDEKDNKASKLSADDLALWDYMTQDVERLQGREIENLSQDTPKKQKKVYIEPKKPNFVQKEPKKGSEIDRRTEMRLQRGQIPIDAVLDLHGMGQIQARDALIRFIQAAQAAGKRHVLVITGKGKRSGDNQGDGVLKRMTPFWLNEPPLMDLVLSVNTAKPKDGGEGALSVYIRRIR